MIADAITYLNGRISLLGYFNNVLCLAQRIEREERIYPAMYAGNEYKQIELDPSGSVCYWIKNGDVNFSKQQSASSVGIEYAGTIPLKLVCFLKKDDAVNDQYFADNIALSLIANLTVNNAALKSMLKAKKAGLSATRTVTDPRSVAADQYSNIDFEPRYTHAYFSIDFDLEFTTKDQCYDDICESMPVSWGQVAITDGTETIYVLCGSAYTCSAGGGFATVENSDESYSEQVNSGDTLVLPDTTYNVYVNGALNQTFSSPSMQDLTINIS